MSILIQNKYYNFEFSDMAVEIKVKEKRKKNVFLNLIVDLVIRVAILIPLSYALVCTIRGKAYFYACIFAPLIVALVGSFIRGLLIEIKKRKKYFFSINQEGIIHTDIDKTYKLYWDEIVCFGLFKHNLISGVRKDSFNTQSCIVFSKKEYSRKQWYNKLDRIAYKRYGHASTEDVIVLDLKQEDDDDISYNRIKEYVVRYCKNATEIKEIWKIANGGVSYKDWKKKDEE